MKAALIPRDRSRHLLRHPTAGDSTDVAGMAGEIERLHAKLKLEHERRAMLAILVRALIDVVNGSIQAKRAMTINFSGATDPKSIVDALKKIGQHPG